MANKRYNVDVEEQDNQGNKRFFIRTIYAATLNEAWLNAQTDYEYFDSDGSCAVVIKVYEDNL